MEPSVGKTLLIWLLLNLLCHCKGLDFCSTMEPNITEGTLMSANFQDFGAQFRCECRITQPRSHPSSLVSSVINFEVEDNSYNQCNQRMVIKVKKLNFNVCPLDAYVQHTLSNIELGSGEHLYIYTLGTQEERWKVKYQFKANQSMDVQCKQINNNTGTEPPCSCAHGGGGGGDIPEENKSGGDDLGTRLGIGFGCVLGLLAIVAIIFLVYILLKRRKRQRSEEPHDMRQAPPLQQKEPPVIHDPRYGIAYPEYAEARDPRINTNLAYTPDNPQPYRKSTDSGLQSMHRSNERLDQPPSYNNHYIPPQPNVAAPGSDPSVLYARPNKPASHDTSRRSLTGMGAITGSNDGLYPGSYADNETYMTDSQTNSQNTSKDFTQTEV